MPSPLEYAFEEALDAAEEVKGQREKVTFRTLQLDALVHEDEIDPDFVAGGTSSFQPVKIDLRTSDVAQPILQLEAITLRGKAYAIMQYAFLAGRVSLTIGDPSEEVQ